MKKADMRFNMRFYLSLPSDSLDPGDETMELACLDMPVKMSTSLWVWRKSESGNIHCPLIARIVHLAS